MATDISICNAGLLMIGADEINSFDDETREARICSALYETTKDELLQSHPWLFTKQQVELAKTANTPILQYQYEYQIPPGSLRILRKDTLANDYEVYQDKLLSDDDGVTIVHQIDPGEENYPSYFVRLLEFSMAEVLAASVAQDESLAQLFGNRKKEQMRKARGIDAQNQPNRRINENQLRLTAVRYQGG